MKNKLWRLNNLYRIVNEEGREVLFQMNAAQRWLYDHMHYLNCVLKARQLGFTTFIQIYCLDDCLFTSNTHAGVIAHNRDDAEDFFTKKIRFAYDHLPNQIKAAVPATQDSVRGLTFANGSSIRVGTSLRSGTYQLLHVSEYGKLCAKFPDKAREVKTGALNTVHAGQVCWIESTAEGQEGHFYELCQKAQDMERSGTKPTLLDFKFHFFAWHQHPGYVLDPSGVRITDTMLEYFALLKAQHGIELTPGQQAWYQKKAEQQGADMKREFPSTPEEAFEAAIEGAYFSKELATAREQGRIGRVPYDPSFPVNTFWDLGRNDSTSIWFHQRIGRENRFFDYYENSGEWLGHYAKALKDKPYVYGEHYAPHDIAVADIGAPESRLQTARTLGLPFITVPAPREKNGAIEIMRRALSSCAFDERGCAQGLKALAAYRKEWDDKLGAYKDHPRHDWASHPSDAFQTFALGYEPTPDPEDDYDDADHDRSEIGGY